MGTMDEHEACDAGQTGLSGWPGERAAIRSPPPSFPGCWPPGSKIAPWAPRAVAAGPRERPSAGRAWGWRKRRAEEILPPAGAGRQAACRDEGGGARKAAPRRTTAPTPGSSRVGRARPGPGQPRRQAEGVVRRRPGRPPGWPVRWRGVVVSLGHPGRGVASVCRAPLHEVALRTGALPDLQLRV